MGSFVLDKTDLEVIHLYQSVIQSELMVKQLTSFIEALSSNKNQDDVFRIFLDLDPKLQEFLYLSTWVAYKRNDNGDFHFGKNQLQKNIFQLLDMQNSQHVSIPHQLSSYYQNKASKKRELAELLEFKKFLQKNPSNDAVFKNFIKLCKPLQTRFEYMAWIYLGKPETYGFPIGMEIIEKNPCWALTQMQASQPQLLPFFSEKQINIVEAVEVCLRQETTKTSKSKRKEAISQHVEQTGFYLPLRDTNVSRLQQQFKSQPQKVYKPWSILLVSAEMTGVIKSGGLAEAVFGKAEGLATFSEQPNKVRVVMPYYSTLFAPGSALDKCGAQVKEKQKLAFNDHFGLGKTNRVFKTKLYLMSNGTITGKHKENEIPKGEIKVYFIEDTPCLKYEVKEENRFDISKEGSVYKPESMLSKRWIYFSSCVAEFIVLMRNKVNLVNFEDFHGALAIPFLWERYPVRMKSGNIPPLVYTFHNLAPHAQGIYSGEEAKEELQKAGLKRNWINTAASAMDKADAVTTVSETFSQEVQSHNTLFNGYLGQEVRNVAMQGKLTGIVNGSNPSVWNPETNSVLANWIDPITKIKTPLNFEPNDNMVEKKAFIKQQLQKWLVVKQTEGKFPHVKIDFSKPTIFFVGRYDASQKGLDLFEAAAKAAQACDANFICMGSQETTDATKILNSLEELSVGKEGIFVIRDQATQNEIGALLRASSEFTYVPSSFEPCGLTQFEAWLFGALVIASTVGGLKDTVKTDKSNFNGYLFNRSENKELLVANTIVQAFKEWGALPNDAKNKIMKRVMENGRKCGWKNSLDGLSPIEKYLYVYAQAAENTKYRHTMFVESGLI